MPVERQYRLLVNCSPDAVGSRLQAGDKYPNLCRACGRPVRGPDERWINLVVRKADDDTIIGRLEAKLHHGHIGDSGPQAHLGQDHLRVRTRLQERSTPTKGYAVEAVQRFVEHLGETGIRELWSTVDPADAASRRLLDTVDSTENPTWERPLGSFDESDVIVVGRRRRHRRSTMCPHGVAGGATEVDGRCRRTRWKAGEPSS